MYAGRKMEKCSSCNANNNTTQTLLPSATLTTPQQPPWVSGKVTTPLSPCKLTSPQPAAQASAARASEAAIARSRRASERPDQWRPHGAEDEHCPLCGSEREGERRMHWAKRRKYLRADLVLIKNKRFLIAADESAPHNANAQSNQIPTPSEIIANIKNIFCGLVKAPVPLFMGVSCPWPRGCKEEGAGGQGCPVYTQIQYFKV